MAITIHYHETSLPVIMHYQTLSKHTPTKYPQLLYLKAVPEGGIFLPLSSCTRFSAYLETQRISPSHVLDIAAASIAFQASSADNIAATDILDVIILIIYQPSMINKSIYVIHHNAQFHIITQGYES